MKETKKNTIYQTPKVTVVTFKVEGGFAPSGIVTENIEQGQDITGSSDDNALVRWQ